MKLLYLCGWGCALVLAVAVTALVAGPVGSILDRWPPDISPFLAPLPVAMALALVLVALLIAASGLRWRFELTLSSDPNAAVGYDATAPPHGGQR